MRKTEEMCVREAMDRRLSSLEASALRRARIRQRIEREEEPEVKRKLTIGMAFALIAALALGGAAVAAGLCGWLWWGNVTPQLTAYEVASPRLPAAFEGYRIVQLSDLHNAELGQDNQRVTALLEQADPDLIVTGTPYPGASRAEEVLDHPALEKLSGHVLRVPDALWTCALPRSLEALAMLSAEAEALR